MKIVYFLDDGQLFGGAANTLLQQAVLMKKAGVSVLLVISNYEYEEMSNAYYSICLKSGIRMIRLPFQISNQPEDIDVICLFEHYSEILWGIQEFNPDLIHSMQINPVAELVARELKKPHIMNIYQLLPEFFSITYMDIFSHYHLCDSQYYAEKWAFYLHTDSRCIRTVVDEEKMPLPNINKNKELCVLCVGTIYERKNQLEVIKAFHAALEAGVKGKLFLCGYDGDKYAEKCKTYIKDNNLQPFIILKGFTADMSKEYSQADVLICGSTIESYPNVVSEAMAHGLIVISTPVAGVPEIIQDGVNGYLCDGYSKESICEKILQLNREWKSNNILQIQLNAYTTYYNEHSPLHIRAKLLDYYQYVLDDYRYNQNQIGITDIKKAFADIVTLYYKNIDYFTDSRVAKRKLWYIFHIEMVLSKLYSENRTCIYIWGTGDIAPIVKEIKEIFFPKFQLAGFIDTYKQGMFYDLPIYYPQEILQQKDSIIFVGAINGQEEIIDELDKNSKIYNLDYFILVPRKW